MLMESFAQRHYVHCEVITLANLKNEMYLLGLYALLKTIGA